MDFSNELQARVVRANDALRRFIAPQPFQNTPLVEAMHYGALLGGKRLRPFLVYATGNMFGISDNTLDAPAAAVECIHAYSLVHDDLPAMDDDDLRRGRPTCHRQFDEATAILCGDALQAFAFETLAAGMPATTAARACLVLARASGAESLVGGQADDLAAERGWVSDMTPAPASEQVAWLERIHRRKTGALFSAALDLGGLAVAAGPHQLAMLAAFGKAFGLAFQIADDILDAEGTEAAMGKRVGKDAQRGKLTYPTVAGVASARERARNLATEAAAAVAPLGEPAAGLAALAHWIVTRDH